MELLWIFTINSATETGRHRINGNNIRNINEWVFIAYKTIRRCRLKSLFCHLDSFWTEHTHMEPNCGRSGTSVITKSDRAGTHIGCAIPSIWDKKHIPSGLTIRTAKDKLTGSCGIAHILSAYADTMPCFDKFLFRKNRFVIFYFFYFNCSLLCKNQIGTKHNQNKSQVFSYPHWSTS